MSGVNRRTFLATSALGGIGVMGSTTAGEALREQDRAAGTSGRSTIEFLDTRAVEHTYFLDRKVTPVEKHPANPLLQDCHSVQAVHRGDDGRLRMWYLTRRKIPGHTGAGRDYQVRYAESEDGVTWTLPELGLKEFDGSTKNNILFTSHDVDAAGRSISDERGIDSFSVIDGKGAGLPHARGRYTALYHPPGREICAAYSEDGIRWTAYDENPVYVARGSDTYNNFLFDARIGRYVLYHRPHPHIHAGHRRVNRLVARVESEDLVHWENARCVLDTDGRDAPAYSDVKNARGRDVQFYGMSVTQHQDFYLGIAHTLNEKTGYMDLRLVHSFDGYDWRREPADTPLIAPTAQAWDAGIIAHVPAGSPVRVEDDLHFYYGAMNMNHNYQMMNDEKSLRMRLGLGIVKHGRLVGYHAGEAEGELVTRPFVLTTPHLALNAACADGEVRVALTAEDGAPLPDFSKAKMQPLREDGLRLPVRWEKSSELSGLVGRKVRLRITARHAALYGLSMEGDGGSHA